MEMATGLIANLRRTRVHEFFSVYAYAEPAVTIVKLGARRSLVIEDGKLVSVANRRLKDIRSGSLSEK